MPHLHAKPKLSLIVVIYNMEREAPRTLYSLSTNYQKGVAEQDFEIIVVDNGSEKKYPTAELESLGGNFRYFYIEDAPASPAYAMNYGVKQARGDYVGLMIDGARIVTPRIMEYALKAFKAFDNPILTAPAWHIGPDIHREAIKKYGHNKDKEDALLDSIEWPVDGYRLHEISTFAGSSNGGWFLPMAESSTLFMAKKNFDELNGYDERFDQPGGGLVNLDMYIRACELAGSDLVVLLGEGSFHQIHGGAMTGADDETRNNNLQAWIQQYEQIRKRSLSRPAKKPCYLGCIPQQAMQSIHHSAALAIKSE